MTIAEQIQALQTDKTNIANAIIAKGGTVNPGDGFDDFATDIATIPSGGGGNPKYGITDLDCLYGDISGGVLQNPTKPYAVNLSSMTSSLAPFNYKFANTGITSLNMSGITATNIDNQFDHICSGCSNLATINFQNISSVTGKYNFNYAFAGAGITTANFPNIVTTPGTTSTDGNTFNHAFSGCPNLTTVNFTSITTAGSYCFQYAFEYCPSLTTINFPVLNTINVGTFTYAFSYCNGLESVSFPALTSISRARAFECGFVICPNLKHLDFSSVVSIGGQYAFSSVTNFVTGGYMNLETIDFSSLTTITATDVFSHAFCYQQKIKDISFPSLTTLNKSNTFSQAFMYSGKLTTEGHGYSFDALEDIEGTNIFKEAFKYNENVTKVSFPKLKTIGLTSSCQSCFTSLLDNSKFYGNGTEWDRLEFPVLESIGKNSSSTTNQLFAVALSGNNKGVVLLFPELHTIYTYGNSSSSYSPFYGCYGLTKVYLPKFINQGTSTAAKGARIFYECSGITELHFGIENQATVEAMYGYSSKFGATNATCYFDLANHITVDGTVYDRSGEGTDYDNNYSAWKNGSNYIYINNKYNAAVGDTAYTRSGTAGSYTYTSTGNLVTSIS